jgi:hypothetical protein
MSHGTGADLRNLDVVNRNYGYFWDEMEYERRKREIFRPVNRWFDFCLIHFHRPDVHQHFYGDMSIDSFDKGKLEQLYRETDELAARIIGYFSDDYDTITFMSDHGLPTQEEHNENAFYSCNKELFGSETPHITDFHDVILEKIGDY